MNTCVFTCLARKKLKTQRGEKLKWIHYGKPENPSPHCLLLSSFYRMFPFKAVQNALVLGVGQRTGTGSSRSSVADSCACAGSRWNSAPLSQSSRMSESRRQCLTIKGKLDVIAGVGTKSGVAGGCLTLGSERAGCSRAGDRLLCDLHHQEKVCWQGEG